ncbi:hypothetical protein CYMTET_48667 [Cymbomonas tetramitiformis]|uniref:15-cis-phytoene synthase n=1 Tax=Cymbomonas tetramitiformis TaxID=36881 RepID=A0AAE0BSW2_9CHLO|nr:hypothetical protein CYMTET_48667 [Cymbomonas tetramitiformis]
MRGLDSASPSIEDCYARCREITAEYAKSFYFATLFQPQEEARAIHALYAWCRTLDEVVDAAADEAPENVQAQLQFQRESLEAIFSGVEIGVAETATSCPDVCLINRALADTVTRIPDMSISPFLDMIKGMESDTDRPVRYEAFQGVGGLEEYAYRVAGTVGLMTIPVLGTEEGVAFEEAAEPGVALGIALQLTNILRDVGEDARRDRIYLPAEDLRLFGVTEEKLKAGGIDPAWRLLMESEIQLALAFYRKAELGVGTLAPAARLPVQLALNLYREILYGVRSNGYDNYLQRAFTSKVRTETALPDRTSQPAAA